MFKVLTEGCEPTRGSKYSACVDLFASEDVVIGAGGTELINLGVCIDKDGLKQVSDRTLETLFGQPIDCIIGTVDGDEDMVYFDGFMRSHYLQLMLRSSLGKKGLILPNGVGIIDLDYRDEIKMIIHNPNYSHFREFAEAEYMDVCKGYDDIFTIKKGDKIAQITLLEHKSYLFNISSEKERVGGIGSTGEQ